MMGYGRLGYEAGHMAGAGFGFGGLIFMFIVAALLTGLLIWLVASRKHPAMAAHAGHYAAFQNQAAAPSAGVAEDAAMQIARERLAKGEIDAEQYTTIVNALKG
ncbi:MAG: hypothetical protein Q8S43_01685 [Actinomycetota bacterium]|nr:MAG: hypothetical protein FD171_1016 [Actinomycetota bacterium]MDO8949251.1 hypothetical protein [Actinomycetota bacterium]MDP3629652.1 hypothetical protein [Actinomycetota bacterium]